MQSNFFISESKHAKRTFGSGVTINATWNSDSILTLQHYDSDDIYIPGSTTQNQFKSNSTMFEWLERRDFKFIY